MGRGGLLATMLGVAAGPGGPSTPPVLPALVGACVSACLTYGFVAWRNLVDRRRAAAERLRTDSAQLRRLAAAIATQRAAAVTARPSPVEVFALRDDLTAQISKIYSRHPRWPLCGELLALLVSPPQMALLTSAWPAQLAGRARSAEAVTAWAIAVEVGVDRLADIVERPTRWRLSGRRVGLGPVPDGRVPT